MSRIDASKNLKGLFESQGREIEELAGMLASLKF